MDYKRCYKDEDRSCNDDCVAHRGLGVGYCMELAAKSKLAIEIGKIRKILEEKKK